MIRFKNFSIKLKIRLIAALGIIALIFTMWSAQGALDHNDAALHALYITSIPTLEKIADSKKTMGAMKELFHEAQLVGDKDWLGEGIEISEKVHADLREIKTFNSRRAADIDHLLSLLRQYTNTATTLVSGIADQSLGPFEVQVLSVELSKIYEKFNEVQESIYQKEYSALKSQLNFVSTKNKITKKQNIVMGAMVILLLIAISASWSNKIILSLSKAVTIAKKIAEGNLNSSINIDSNDEVGELLTAMTQMQQQLQNQRDQEHKQQKLESLASELNKSIRGNLSLEKLCFNILTSLAQATRAYAGILYIPTGKTLEALVAYACEIKPGVNDSYELGESLVGQCASNRRQLKVSEIPEGYIHSKSAIGSIKPQSILLIPVSHHDELQAVIELASFVEFSQEAMDFTQYVTEDIGIAINSTQNRLKLSAGNNQSDIAVKPAQSSFGSPAAE